MPLDIQFSEQGSLSHIVRGVQIILALDQIDAVSVRFDLDSAPWRHFFSGREQRHLRQITRDIRTPHLQSKFRATDIKQIAMCSPPTLGQDAPENTWLVTLGAPIDVAPADLHRYIGHIHVGSAQKQISFGSHLLSVPVGICAETFARQPLAPDGILLVGCGDVVSDNVMLDILRPLTRMPLDLFDVYSQHVKRPLQQQVRIIEPQNPSKRAALYAASRFVISGSTQPHPDDHFVTEAAKVGCIVVGGTGVPHAPGAR